jgi:hypothetical protein
MVADAAVVTIVNTAVGGQFALSRFQPFPNEKIPAEPAVNLIPGKAVREAPLAQLLFRMDRQVGHGRLPQIEAETFGPAVKTAAGLKSPFNQQAALFIAP